MYQRKTGLFEQLWDSPKAHWWLLLASSVGMLVMLGSKILWTQEWRWASITQEMFIRKDFLHPYLYSAPYYDKPLLSYWLIAAIAYFQDFVSTWALRLPSALSGIFAVWLTYKIGELMSNRRTGLIAGWMLISTFYFVFWGRVGNTDMLNVAGTLLSVYWYLKHRDQPSFINYSIFFLILAVSSLFKGLLAITVSALVILPDLLHGQRWKKHLHFRVIVALVPGVLVYFFPFWLSTYFNDVNYPQSGLQMVYRENILRYVDPFDHKGPIYTYFLYLPLYTLPWIFFMLPALKALPKRWTGLAWGTKWFFWAVLICFLFFTGSGSRRSYYTLPMVPFALLFTAEWINENFKKHSLRVKLAFKTALAFFVLLLSINGVFVPVAQSDGDVKFMAEEIKTTATKLKPWNEWQITFIEANNKISYYLHSKQRINFNDIDQGTKDTMTQVNFVKLFPMIPKANQVIVMDKQFLPYAQPYLKDYQLIYFKPYRMQRWMHDWFGKEIELDRSVALVPLHL